MSKNLTRKGLAFGALVALGASVFAGTPANAASAYITSGAYAGVSTNLTAVASTSYGMILNTTFKTLPDGLDADNLKYKVEIVTPGFEMDNRDSNNAALADVTLTAAIDSNTNGADFGAGEANSSNSTNVGGFPVDQTTDYGDSSLTNYSQISVFAAKATQGTPAAGSPDSVAPDFTDNNLLQLQLDEELTQNLTVRVTPWVDTIANNKIDANEIAVGDSVDVVFVPLAKVALSVGIKTPVLGAASYTGYATLGGVNLGVFDAVNADDTELWMIDRPGTVADATVSAIANVDEIDLVYDAVDDRLEAVQGSPNGGTVIAGSYQVRFSLDGATSGTIFTSNTSTTVATAIAADAALDATAGEGVGYAKASTGADVVQATGATTAASVDILARATAAKSINFTSQLYKTYDATNGHVLAGAGVVTTVTISRSAIAKLDSTSVITAGGKTLSGSGNELSISFDVVSDSTGKIAFTVASNTAKALDEVEIDIAAEGKTATQQTLKWVEEAYTLYTSNGTSAVKVAIGGSTKVDFVAKDQFGSAPATAQVQVTRANSSGDRDLVAEQASFAYNTALTAGRGTVTISDNGAAATTGIDTITAQLQVAAAAGGGYVNKGSAVNFDLEYVSTLATATLDASANNNGVKEGTTDVQKISLETKTLANWDDRFDSTTATAYDWTPGYANATVATTASAVTVSGNVKTAAGVGIAGVPVTLTNTGLLFATKSGNIRYSLDSITVLTDSSGAYAVDVIGTTSGKRTVAVVAGALTKSVDLTFAGGSKTAAAFTVSTSTAVAVPGRTVDVTVSVKDANGNAAEGVSVALRSTGAGYLQAATGTTDASGNVYVKLISGVNDGGDAVIYASVTIAGVVTEKSATVTVAAPVVAPVVAGVSGGTGKFNVAVTNAAGKTVVVKVAGKFFRSFAGSADKKTVALKAPKGSHKVTVYVGGKLVANKTVSVK